jgi:hypothetical protein
VDPWSPGEWPGRKEDRRGRSVPGRGKVGGVGGGPARVQKYPGGNPRREKEGKGEREPIQARG